MISYEKYLRVMAVTREQGGVTIDVMTGNPVTEGFAVATAMNELVITDVLALPAMCIDSYTLVAAFMVASKHQSKVFGTWKCGSRIHIEPVDVFTDRNEALKAGRQRKQQSIFDLSTNTEIPC